MSWLSKAVKGVGHTLGHYLSESGKLAGYIPGVGPVIGGAMTAAGGLIEGDPIKDALLNGAKAGVMQYGVGKLASHIPGVAKVGDMLKGAVSHVPGGSRTVNAVASRLPGVTSVGSMLGGGGGADGGGGGGFSGFLSKYGTPALLAAQGLNAANLGRQSSQYGKDALSSVQQSYAERAPLRAKGLAAMLNPASPNLSALRTVASSNPYAPKPATSMLEGA